MQLKYHICNIKAGIIRRKYEQRYEILQEIFKEYQFIPNKDLIFECNELILKSFRFIVFKYSNHVVPYIKTLQF